jgi:uncharacterized protein
MYISNASLKTEHASKYLKQLCKHFSHKVSTEYDDNLGKVKMPPGPCVITANQEELTFQCQSQDAKGIQVMQSIIEQHLVKFAWREELNITWNSTEQ